MKLISLSIVNFGKLQNYDLTFEDGLTTVCRENGWGKSTLAAFLKAMFYGLPKSGKHDLDDNDYKRYTPWQGGTFGGNLVFSCQKGTFRVERTFGENESFALYDVETGLRSSAFSESLGAELFGIDAEGFEQSVFLSARALSPKDKNDSVRAKLTGIDEIHDMSNFEKARNELEARAKEYKKRGGGGLIGDTEEKIKTLKEKLAEARAKSQPQKNLEDELAGVREQIARRKQEEKELQGARIRAERFGVVRNLNRKLDDLKRQKEALESRFPGEVPPREELAACRKRIEQAARDRATLAANGLNREEQEELVSLDRHFLSAGAPNADVLNEKLCLAKRNGEEEAQIRHELLLTEQELQSAEERLAALPELRELEQANQLTVKADKKGAATAFFILTLLLLPAGSALLLAGILQRLQPLLFAGIAALGVGLFCLSCSILFSVRRHRAGTERQSHMTAEINRVLQRFNVPESRDPHTAIALLCAQRSSAESAREKAAAKREELAGKQKECRQKNAELCAFLANYNVFDTDPVSGLFKLSGIARKYDALCKKQKAAKSTEDELRAKLAEAEAELARFFARCPKDIAGEDEQDLLAAVEELCANRESLCRAIAEWQEELQRKLEEAGLSDPSLLKEEPESFDLAERQREIEAALAALGETENALISRLSKLTSETEQIPEWEEELARLGEELIEQKKRYELLCKTRDLLVQAHDDLTTRYLPATRERFSEYLALLAGKNIPKATLAADFSVTVLDTGMSRPAESYSRGWRDLLRFCVRLALIDALYAAGEEMPFLLLDDPFTYLDEERLAAAKALLTRLAESRQILYLVCHGDRV